MDSNPIHHPSPAKKIKCSFLDYIQLLMIGRAGRWTGTPSATPLQPKKWNAHFGLHSTFDDRQGWSMDSNPICHPSPANKIKCSFLDYVQLLMMDLSHPAGWWTLMNPMDSNPIHPSPAKKRKCSFWITFNFWWLAGLVDGLEPHLPPLSSQKNKMLILGWLSTSWAGMDSNPICHPSPANKIKCSFLDYV